MTCQTPARHSQYTWEKHLDYGTCHALSNKPSFHFYNLQPSDSGVYRCRAETRDAVGEKHVQVVVKPLMRTAGTTDYELTSFSGKGMAITLFPNSLHYKLILTD